RFEVDRDEKVSAGFFSDVYSGTWQGETVAIKVLAESIPTQLFLREMQTWTTLQHPNVLRVYGGSSGADDPPLFFVTPYMKNGSLVQYLKWIETDTQPNTPAGTRLQSTITSKAHSSLQKSSSQVDSNRPDLTRFMHEIAKGMEYLHNKGVLHGDLRAVNVLVDDDLACRISDFGQNEMKSEAVRTSGLLPSIGGTLRWQSPEYMSGASPLTPEVDVWAFSITCVEILTMGRIPWPLEDDDTVRDLVLKGNLHPPLPKILPFNIPPALLDILNNCWCVAPEDRLPFQRVTAALHSLRNSIRYNSLKSTPPFFHAAMPGSEPKRVQSAQAALRSKHMLFFMASIQSPYIYVLFHCRTCFGGPEGAAQKFCFHVLRRGRRWEG
ncbi:kinase-like domain-containing protein, partial [Flammula alnicola]